jgi:general secretion pathway protein K
MVDWRTGKPGQRAHAGERGYALVIAILMTGLAGLLIAGFSSVVRTHIRSTALATDLAAAEAFANAGVSLALVDLLETRRDSARPPRYPVGGAAGTCEVPGGAITVGIRDTAGLIDINWASEDLLAALLVGIGQGVDQARTFAAAIIDYRDPDNVARNGGAETDDYKAAGQSKRPKNAPFDSIAELEQVLGIDRALVETIRPYVTIHSQLAGIDPAATSTELIDIVSRGLAALPGKGSAIGFGSSILRPEVVTPSLRRSYQVQIGVRSGQASLARDAVVSVMPGGERTHKMLSWTRRSTASPGSQGAVRELGPC